MEDEAFLVIYLVIHADKTDKPCYSCDFHHLATIITIGWYTNNYRFFHALLIAIKIFCTYIGVTQGESFSHF